MTQKGSILSLTFSQGTLYSIQYECIELHGPAHTSREHQNQCILDLLSVCLCEDISAGYLVP